MRDVICKLTNEELGSSLVMTNKTMFIFDRDGDFITEFDARFCPVCGEILQNEVADE
jgi:hypothetical protein